jgi:hypothetical protein
MKERQTGLHASTYYLPIVRSHADAMARLKKTKPIRGRTPETRDKYDRDNPTPCIPLGRREDIDIYSIREGEGGNIELLSYRSPLLTFTPDNKIIITPKYMGLMESGMIGRVLDIPAWLDRKKVGIIVDAERHVLKQNGSLTLSCEGECLSVDSKETIYSYYVNRKASNIVRSQYSGFMKYFGGFLSLRKDVEGRDIRMSMMEIADCIGYEYKEQTAWRGIKASGKETVWKPDLDSVKLIEFKPQGYRCLSLLHDDANPEETLWSAYSKQCKSFFAAIRDDQLEDGKVDNYYRITLTLLGMAMPYIHRAPKEGEDVVVDISVSAVERMLDKIMMQWHSDEMIEKRPLKPNQLPNDKYEAYITKMPTEEEVKRLQEERLRRGVL